MKGTEKMAASIEVLTACMHRVDTSLYNDMHLSSDAVFANQGDNFSYTDEIAQDGIHKVKMITTAQRGVGRNRNTALLYATGDILLMADEDMVYSENYVQAVLKAFEELPKADMIIFDLLYRNTITGKKREIKSIKRLRWYNSLRYGTARIAIRREALQKVNIWFSLLYGGGAPRTSGEDCLFIRDALRKKLTGYIYPYVIAEVKQESSTWFTGFTDKYYIDKGFWLANAFPVIGVFLSLYYAFRLSHKNGRTPLQLLGLLLRGVKQYKKEGIQ